MSSAPPSPEASGFPPVTAILPTHNRPELVRKAIASITAQEYPGKIDVLVVFDRSEPDSDLMEDGATRRVQVIRNSRSDGLAGARNTGIEAAGSRWIAFCDDDDTWEPNKLIAQMRRIQRTPEALFCTTAMKVLWDGNEIVRTAGADMVQHEDLLRSRMAMLHSSSFLMQREAVLDGGVIGPVDEDLPGSMAEDWDLLLRASAAGPIIHVDEPLVNVLWGATSYFNDSWRTKNEAHAWLLDHYPAMRDSRTGYGLMVSKLAFGHAALGERREAWQRVREGVRIDWRQPRTVLALAVLAGLPAERIVRALNSRGRGI